MYALVATAKLTVLWTQHYITVIKVENCFSLVVVDLSSKLGIFLAVRHQDHGLGTMFCFCF